jgi:hypothetical protein
MSMTKPNVKQVRNSPRVPLVLMFLIGGSFVGMKWVKQVAATHEHQRLEVLERSLIAEIDQLKLDILDQRGRMKELTVRSRIALELPKHGIEMVDAVKASVITVKDVVEIQMPELAQNGGQRP